MILFTILSLTLAILLLFIILVVGAGGAIFTIIFADVIVCIFVILWIMSRIVKRKSR